MPKRIDLTGLIFDRWTVIKEAGRNDRREVLWLCECKCGNSRTLTTFQLTGGRSRSCGCLLRDMHTTHGCSNHSAHKPVRLYNIWMGMKNRCRYSYPCTKNYFGRGIDVCEEWQQSFESFQNWAETHGYDDGLTLDRINNEGNYEPDNCRWISMHEQFRNLRKNVFLTFNGRTQIMKDWANELGICYETIVRRHKKGWSDEECLFGRR